jgi:hypothetical protein
MNPTFKLELERQAGTIVSETTVFSPGAMVVWKYLHRERYIYMDIICGA